MDLAFEISKRLSREHQEVIHLLARLQAFLQSSGGTGQPDWRSPEARRVMSDLKGALRTEIPNHFTIEEAALFPVLAQEDGVDLVELLLADHAIILGLAADLAPLVEKTLAAPEAVGQAEWERLRALGLALATELTSHAEKEEFGFVPAMDERLDPATAKEILDRYQRM